METEEDERFQTQKVAESSMDVSALNNLIVSGRPLFKKVKVQVIERLSRQMKKYAKRKRGKKQVSAYQKKVQTALEEISAIKGLNPDYAVKFAFANELPFEKIAAQGDVQKRALGRIATHPVMQQKVEKWRNCHDDWKSLAAFMLSKNTGRRFKKKSTQKGDSMTSKIVKKKLPKPIPGQELQIKCQKTSKQYLGVSAITSDDGANFPRETVNTFPEQFNGHTDEKMKLPDFSGSKSESVDSSVKKPVEKSSLNRTIHENSSKIKEKAMNKNIESNRSVNKDMVVKKLCLDDITGDGDLLISGNPNDKSVSFLFESDLPRKKINKDNFFVDSSSEVDNASDDNGDGHSELDVGSQEENSWSLDNEGSVSKNSRKVFKSTFLETLLSRENKRKSNPCENKQRKQNDQRYREPRESDGSFQRSGQKGKQKDFNLKEEESIKEGIPRFSRSAGRKEVKKEECAEKLHPSWEASRKRKEQMSTFVEFKGKKIKFDDD